MSVFDWLTLPRSIVVLDDGGLRVTSRDGYRYIPFAELADADVDFWPMRRALLRLTARDGSTINLRVQRDEALALQSDVATHLRGTSDAAALVGEAVRSALARNAAPLAEWLANVARWAMSSGGYRSATLDHATAQAALLEPRAPVELRAALVHAMLSSADEEDLAAVAKAFVLRALPPLVVVAARLGRGGAALVPDAMCEDALWMLPASERDDARRAMAAPVTHDDEARVHAIMERVKEAALAEAEAERAKKPHHARKRHHAHALGGYAEQQGVTRFK